MTRPALILVTRFGRAVDRQAALERLAERLGIGPPDHFSVNPDAACRSNQPAEKPPDTLENAA
jgi:hypothetical protein